MSTTYAWQGHGQKRMETRPAGEDKPVEPAAAALMPRSSSPVPPAELEIAVDGATGRPSTTPSADSWHHQQMFPKRIGAVACSSAWSSPRRPKDCYGRSASCEISRGWLHWSWFGLVAPAPAQQHSARYGTRFPPFSALQPRGRSRHRPYWPSAQPSVARAVLSPAVAPPLAVSRTAPAPGALSALAIALATSMW